MAKGIYVGIDNKAKKIKNLYVGVGYLAKRITKAYVGVGGKARLCYCLDYIAYYGTAENLLVGRSNLAAASTSDYAIFGGGRGNYEWSLMTTDFYDANLTKTQGSYLSDLRFNLAAVSSNNKAFFAGGQYSYTGFLNNVEIYNTYNSYYTSSLRYNKAELGASKVGNYALFAGGATTGSMHDNTASVDGFDTSSIRTLVTDLSEARSSLGGANTPSYALFAGGINTTGNGTNRVDAYNSSLTQSLPDTIKNSVRSVGASAGKKALFFASNAVTAFDDSLTSYLVQNVVTPNRSSPFCCSLDDFAIFAGGVDTSSDNHLSQVFVFDSSLSKTFPQELSAGRSGGAATSIGEFALFGGGYTSSGDGTGLPVTNVVDVYKVYKQ